MTKLSPKKSVCAAAAISMAAAAALAQTPPAKTAEPIDPAIKMQGFVRDFIFERITENSGAGATRKSDGQAEAMGGREDLVADPWTGRPDCIPLAGDPIGAIVERARATNIVIINESHSASLDRHFIGDVLTALRGEGYAIYAAETFSPYDRLDHDDATGTDGWYSNEPIFARTIRTAKGLGYKLVAYEQTDSQYKAAGEPKSQLARVDSREQDQTSNLMAAIFTDNPGAKVLIHVGDAHASERPRARPGSTWMAARLKAATGRDPLTISQIDCRSTTPSMVIAEDRLDPGATINRAAHPVDLYVGHPERGLRDGRPAWRQAVGDVATPMPAVFVGLKERVIVEARREDQRLGAVPIDRVLLFPGESLPLLLPPGRYRVDGFGIGGRLNVAPAMVTVTPRQSETR